MSESRIDIPGKGPIVFQGVELPTAAKHFDIAMPSSSMPKDIKEWVLDLRYAWGRNRHASSSFVLNACDQIESHILKEHDKIFSVLRMAFEDASPAKFYNEWLTALRIIRKCAQSSRKCHWTVRPESEEVTYFLNQTIRMQHAMEKAQNTIILPKEFVNYIHNATEDEQIEYILSINDSLNS